MEDEYSKIKARVINKLDNQKLKDLADTEEEPDIIYGMEIDIMLKTKDIDNLRQENGASLSMDSTCILFSDRQTLHDLLLNNSLKLLNLILEPKNN
jgi:hypothetical protein